MNKRKILLPVILLLCAGTLLQAQVYQQGFFVKNYRPVYRINPALIPESDFIAAFEFSRNNVSNYGASAFLYPYQDGLVTGLHESVPAALFLGNLPELSVSNQEYDLNLFSYGFARGRGYHSMEINVRVPFSTTLSKEAFELLKTGMTRDKYDLSGMSLQGKVYVELAYGYGYRLSDVVTIGGRAKLLLPMYGLAYRLTNMDVVKTDSGISVSTQGELDLPQRLKEFMAAPGDPIKLSDMRTNDRIPLPIGAGLAVDLGVTVTPNEYLTLSASVQDLGAIVSCYGNAATTSSYEYFDGVGTLSYADLNKQGLTKKLKELGKEIVDGISVTSRYNKVRVETLPFAANLGVRYTLPFFDQIRVGAIANYVGYQNMPYWEARLGADYSPFRWLEVTGSFGRGACGFLYGFGVASHFYRFSFYFGYENGTAGLLPRSTTPVKANHRTWSVGLTYDL